jgi:predicted aldo/keto reductase-like oxidoreductase
MAVQYRPFGRLGFQVSALGFGCMRFPKTEAGRIDEDQTIPMLEYALDHGVNYLDTAHMYNGGDSERLLGRVLAARAERIARGRDAYTALCAVRCTACGYCMPCPNGVDIPRCFTILNGGLMYDMADARSRYTRFYFAQTDKILGSSCVQCQECETKCPQHIPISAWMPYVHQVLGEGRSYDRRECPPG